MAQSEYIGKVVNMVERLAPSGSGAVPFGRRVFVWFDPALSDRRWGGWRCRRVISIILHTSESYPFCYGDVPPSPYGGGGVGMPDAIFLCEGDPAHGLVPPTEQTVSDFLVKIMGEGGPGATRIVFVEAINVG